MRTYVLGAYRSTAFMLFAALFSPGAEAQVQVKVLEDGTKLISNENQVQRARRTSARLVAVPSAQIHRLIDHHARRQGLSPRLVQAVVQVESGYNPRALSNKGAMGLMQLMPQTARELRVADPYDPDQNIRGGTTYLRKMMGRFGDLERALAAYNAGPTAVEKYRGIPPYRETRNYVRKVLGLYYNGQVSSLPSTLVREHVREVSEQREQSETRASQEQRGGDPVFITRDESGRILVSTSSNSD